MTLRQITGKIADAAGLTQKQAALLISVFEEKIIQALQKGHSCSLPGFGTFSIKIRKERTGFLPSLGKKVLLPAGKKIHFRPAQEIKNHLKKAGL